MFLAKKLKLKKKKKVQQNAKMPCLWIYTPPLFMYWYVSFLNWMLKISHWMITGLLVIYKITYLKNS